MSAAAAAAPLEVARVRANLRRLRESLTDSLQLLRELHESRAWLTLGLPSWNALCEQELPELRELLTTAQKMAAAVELRGEHRASLRVIAGALDVSPATVKTWTDNAGIKPTTVTGVDGVERPATVARKAPAKRRPLVDRIVALLVEHPGGLDVLEVAERLKVRQARVSPALCRLAKSGRVTYRRPAKRGQLGRYVVGGRR